MMMKLCVSKMQTEFVVKEYVRNDSGEQVPVPGDPVYLVEFEPLLLKREDFLELLGKSKDHVLEVKA